MLCRVTGLLEAAGYAALIYAIEKSGKSSVFNAYVAMQVLVVLSPNVIQAAMYWCVVGDCTDAVVSHGVHL